jgi:hypothetical protein
MTSEIRQTHTYAVMEVSRATYDEIARKLTEAGYDHAFIEDSDGVALDMHGIALLPNPGLANAPRCHPSAFWTSAHVEVRGVLSGISKAVCSVCGGDGK